LSGEKTYDLLHGFFNTQAIAAGTVIDLSEEMYIDLEKPYYLRFINEEMNILNRQYTVTGYFDMETLGRTSAVFFSSKLASDYNVGDLYEMVDNNEWTFDKMMSVASESYSDIDGDGVMTDKDQYGLCGAFNMNAMLIMSTGYRYTEKLPDGTRQLTCITDTLLGMNEMLFDAYAYLLGMIFIFLKQ